jgi:hypothetical protein
MAVGWRRGSGYLWSRATELAKGVAVSGGGVDQDSNSKPAVEVGPARRPTPMGAAGRVRGHGRRLPLGDRDGLAWREGAGVLTAAHQLPGARPPSLSRSGRMHFAAHTLPAVGPLIAHHGPCPAMAAVAEPERMHAPRRPTPSWQRGRLPPRRTGA